MGTAMANTHGTTQRKGPIWRLACTCGGVVRVESGDTARWIFVCSDCGGGMELLDRLSRGYNLSISRILDGPQTCKELPWQRPQPKQTGPPAPNLTGDERRLARRYLWRDRNVLGYLRNERGFTLKTIRDAKLGYFQPDPKRPPGIIIPIPPDKPVSYRIRYWPDLWLPPGSDKVVKEWSAADGCWHERRAPKPVKISHPVGQRQRLYPKRPLGGSVVLCEAEMDCLITRQHGVRAVASPGCQIKGVLAVALGRSACRVAVCFDQGADEAAERAVRLLQIGGAEAWAVNLGLRVKNEDLTDHFVAYGRSADDLRELIREARHA